MIEDNKQQLFIVTVKEIKNDIAICLVDEGELDISVKFPIDLIKKLELEVDDKFEWNCPLNRSTIPSDCKCLTKDTITEEDQIMITNLLDFSKNINKYKRK
jgi:hypothetical protein